MKNSLQSTGDCAAQLPQISDTTSGAVGCEARQVARSNGDGSGTHPKEVWLLAGLGLALVAIHLSLLYRIDSSGQLGISLLTWPAVVYLFQQRWRARTWSCSLIGSALGVLILVVALSNSAWTGPRDRFFPYLYPLLAGAGFVLLTSGFGGLRTHWREMTILFCLGVPRLLLGEMEVLPPVTARIAGFMIWYLGQEVEVLGTELVMPAGAVVVDQGCAGPGIMSYLICLAVIFVFLFRPGPRQRWLALFVGPAIAFVTNVIRVVVLALLEGSGRHEAFSFWHTGFGSLFWNALPVVFFGIVVLSAPSAPRDRGGSEAVLETETGTAKARK